MALRPHLTMGLPLSYLRLSYLRFSDTGPPGPAQQSSSPRTYP